MHTKQKQKHKMQKNLIIKRESDVMIICLACFQVSFFFLFQAYPFYVVIFSIYLQQRNLIDLLHVSKIDFKFVYLRSQKIIYRKKFFSAILFIKKIKIKHKTKIENKEMNILLKSILKWIEIKNKQFISYSSTSHSVFLGDNCREFIFRVYCKNKTC